MNTPLTLAAALLLGCGPAAVAPAADSHADPAARRQDTFVYLCPDRSRYTVRTEEDSAWVFRPQGTLRLPRQPAASGARYSDGRFTLWSEGQEARIREPGQKTKHCHNDRRQAVWEKAKLDGADFRAVGNEPGWNLEIRNGNRLRLVTDYGASRIELTLPKPREDPQQRLTRWHDEQLDLSIRARPCIDSMSGERFESEVLLRWQGRTLRGCGRALH